MSDELRECQLSAGCRLAQAYVPIQVLNQVYSQSEALRRGTLFPELYMPYIENNNMKTGGRYHG